VKVDHLNVSFRSLFNHLVKQTKWALNCLWASWCDAQSVYCESWLLWRELSFTVWSHDHLIMWSCCLWASQCNAQSVYVSVTYAYRAVTALSMRLFSSSNKHSLQKICSQHLIQINLVVDSDHQEILVKITRNIISRKKIHCQFQKWELNFKNDENARFNE